MTQTPPPTQDDLAAGEELDALIAEKVFGWQPWPLGTHLGGITLLRNPATGAISPPAYSTEIGAAWTVLDEMVWRVGTANIRLDMEDYGRGAGTSGKAERAVWVTIGEHTAVGPAPLAICRAALQAVSAQP